MSVKLSVTNILPKGSGASATLNMDRDSRRPVYNINKDDVAQRFLDGVAFTAKTASASLTARDAGKIFSFASATGFTLTLPAAASVPAGEYRFVVGTTASSGNHAVDVIAADTIKGNGLSLSAGDPWTLTGFVAGDAVTLTSDGTSIWYITAVASGIEGSDTFTAINVGSGAIIGNSTALTTTVPIRTGDGSAAAPSYSFTSDSNTGFYLAGPDILRAVANGGTVWTASAGVLDINGTLLLSSDVALSRGAANRLDLASGDSFYLVNGDVTVANGKNYLFTNAAGSNTIGLRVDSSNVLTTGGGGINPASIALTANTQVSGGLGVGVTPPAAGMIGLTEQTAPSAPAANAVTLYAVDNGAGKTQLMALFASGAAQQVAIQP